MTQPTTAAPRGSQSSRLIDAVPFFYGWVILVVGALGTVMMGPSQTFTIGLFVDAWGTDLGLTRAGSSLFYGLATLGASLLLPITGRLTDHWGSRIMIVLTTVGLALACVGTGMVQSAGMLLGAFLALRFFGFGSMQLVSNHVIAQWFIERRGTVMGLAGQSLAISLIVWPLLGEFLLQRTDWRTTWMLFAVIICAVMLPVGWLFFRDTPERYGQEPDGNRLPVAGGGQSQVAETNWTLAEARRTAVFWIFAVGMAVMTMLMSGTVFHQVSIYAARGLPREVAVQAFTVTAIVSIAGNLGMGWLLDRFSARRLLALVMAMLTTSLLLLDVMTAAWQGLLAAAIFGLVSGSYRVMDSTIWAKYYGRKHLGSIRGATMIGTLGGTAFGAYPLGLSFDVFGSYTPALTALMVLPITIALVAVFARRPQKSNSGQTLD